MDVGWTPELPPHRIAAHDQARAGLRDIAGTLHDFFLALIGEGFERSEALELVREWFCKTIEPGAPEDE